MTDNWYKPAVLRRVRIRIHVILVLIVAIVIYLQHGWILDLFKSIFQS